jgi:hypothetical protein
MTGRMSGGCLCGAIRYDCEAGPIFAGNCHCKDCQRTSGGPYTPAMLFRASDVRITGVPRYYRSHGDSGRRVERGFCSTCGSQIFAKLEALPDVIGVKAGTLDDGALFRPAVDFYVASAQPWDRMDLALPKFLGPPRAAET